MREQDLGLDNFTERDGEDRFITVSEDAGEETKIELERQPVCSIVRRLPTIASSRIGVVVVSRV
jgi:hypothetical protein